ncbi:MAG: methyltransferase domain-containing protein [Acidimicrobiales bacterium]|nr:methyltransferase domain-containing protein [Acidimicrobiales bacterium]
MESPRGTAIRPNQEIAATGSELVPCPICGSEKTRLFRTDVTDLEYFVDPLRDLLIQKCGECESQFLNPRPTESELPRFYPSDYHAYNENHSRVARMLVEARARSRARFYGRLIEDRPGSIFDVGTGDCRHFDELRRFIDLECAGVEIQSEIAAKGRARGYEILEGTLEAADLTDHVGKYHVVSMNHVLEHVIEPRTMLERAHDLLRPGGHLIGQLPTVTSWESRLFGRNWGGYHYPRHLQIPSRSGLANLLKDLGFQTVRVRSAPHIQTTISLQNTLVRWGWRPRMQYGKTPIYSGLLVAALPYETVAWLCDKGGIVDFKAQKSRS